MTTHNNFERTMFETPRVAEYFNAQELQAQTGQPIENFATVALKELIDNALDACETAGVSPTIRIDVERIDGLIHLSVSDNGTGISSETVERILNFQTRTSDKTAYRSLTRGAQGNALKTILGMPWALGVRRPIEIVSMGVRHSILAWIDPAGELRIEHERNPVSGTVGTRIRMSLPIVENQTFRPDHLTRGFALFNPHALVNFSYSDTQPIEQDKSDADNSNSYRPSVRFPGEWRKFLPTDLTSPWWYSMKDLEKLIFSYIAETRRDGRDHTLREFVRQFRGLSGTGKAKAVCNQLPEIHRLSNFEREPGSIEILWKVMRQTTKPPAPRVLGLIGEEHFRRCFDEWYEIKPNRFWYAKRTGPCAEERKKGGVPFVFEAVVAETEKVADFFPGLNFTPTYRDFLEGTYLGTSKIEARGIRGFLQNAHVDLTNPWHQAKTAVAVHLACPMMEFLDRGKTHLKTSDDEEPNEEGYNFSLKECH